HYVIHLINFEFKKMGKSIFFRIMILVFILFFTIYYTAVYMNAESVYKAMLAEDRGIIERHKGEEDPDFTIKRAMENAKERLIAYENDDWTTILDTHIRDYQKMVTQEQNLVGA